MTDRPEPSPAPDTPGPVRFPQAPSPLPWLTFKRLARSLDLLRRYGTTRKFGNLLRAEMAFRRHQVEHPALPYLFRADPTTRCTLGCPYCWRTISPPLEPARLSLARFVEGFAPFADTCLLVSFQMFGEPTLNDELPDMVQHAHALGAATYVSTNLQRDDRDCFRRLLSAGLDLLTVSFDAVTPETYRRMKPGGDFELLQQNVSLIFELKRGLHPAPAVGLQTLVTRHNERELPRIRARAHELGADYVDFKSVLHLPDESWVPSDRKYRIDRYAQRRPNCSMPWTGITLLAGGRYFPCCTFPGDYDLGPGVGDVTRSVWNGAPMQSIREGFRTGSLHDLCRRCPLARLPRF